VTFKELDEAAINAYVATGETIDKAGAYGIQGKGAALVDHYEGDYNNIVGLPVDTLLANFPDLLRDHLEVVPDPAQ
jgi:septum formation protein